MNTLLLTIMMGMIFTASEPALPKIDGVTDITSVMDMSNPSIKIRYQAGGGYVMIFPAEGAYTVSDPTPVVIIDEPEYVRLKSENDSLRKLAGDSKMKQYQLLKENNDKAAENGRLKDLITRIFTAKTLDELREEIQAILILGNQSQEQKNIQSENSREPGK